ncbi:nucleoside triphosphate pyrophosphohydrolase [Marinomonas ostreistagni]|uniref:nucleoside triphosphate pyrophosphohydrolase n=1 Tax=Marinomonas ostreistagni TaxID=359209 RepID=UPI00195006C3|nr:nucleoside triphosphate pyrophosphohydrolase [Marinomonas ostreistagni]
MKYDTDDLLALMTMLRDRQYGCPWDIRQDFSTIAPYTIEEAYEVLDAIVRGDRQDLKEELGDLLFQVVFHAQMASEENAFNFQDVVHGIVAKMLRRHPHVFPDGSFDSYASGVTWSEAEIAQQWQLIKAQEKAQKGESAQVDSLLDTVPETLPVLTQAVKLQKKASTVGFDWDDVAPVFDKIREELDELEQAVKTLSQDEVEAELGDVLFAVANLARHFRLSPEQALMRTNVKFRRRFGYIETALSKQNKPVTDCSLGELDQLWEQAKAQGL